MNLLAGQHETLDRLQPMEIRGSVAAVRGLSLLVDDLALPIGSMVRLESRHQQGELIRGEVVGFNGQRSIVMLYGHGQGIAPGTTVVGEQTAQTVQVGPSILGRVVDAFGTPMDSGSVLHDTMPRPLHPAPLSALQRSPIVEPMPTGVRAIDSMTTLGQGQRIGIFAGPGVGKSTLLGSIARHTSADVNVIAMVGERGREVREFLDDILGEEGLRRSVVVVSTGNESPLLRVRAAFVATTIAEFFRDLGNNVLLMMDSVTRFAQAQRQIGLNNGEQPATKGYTPSVFAMLPVLLERAGSVDGGGSITGLYTVLVEGDDLTEPVSDAARGILDGHIALSRKLASRGHFPAIDVQESVSRVADQVCDEVHVASRRLIGQLLASYSEAEELINIGAYAHGSNPMCDVAIGMKPELDAFLQQERDDPAPYPMTCRRLMELAQRAVQEREQRAAQGGGMAAQATPSGGAA